MPQPFFSSHTRWLTTTGTALELLLSLAGHSQASTSLQFGQPLPGRPTPAATTAPAANPASPATTPTAAPARRRPSSLQRRPAARPPQRSANPAPQAAPSQATTTTGGWDVPSGTTGVYRSPDTLPSRPTSRRRAPANPARTLRQPLATGPSTRGSYTVYVLGDRLSLLDQISQITPSAAFTTYNQQTAISAGSFTRSIDAQARVRELSQIGLKGIISAGTSPSTPAPRRTYPSYSADPATAPTPVDPAHLFDNFDSRAPQNIHSIQAIATTNRLPIPSHGRTPPRSRKHSRRLPAPPPSLEQQIAHAQSPQRSRPAVSPLFRDITRRNQATNRQASSYHLNIPLNNQPSRQVNQRLTALGVPSHKLNNTSANTTHITVGPFANLSEANWWSRKLKTNGIVPQVTQNGWVVEAP